MKLFLIALTIFSSSLAFAASPAKSGVSKCVIRNWGTGSSSGIVDMLEVNTYADPLMNTQEISFEDLKVVFSNGFRKLNLFKADKSLASVRVSALRSGNKIQLSGYEIDPSGNEIEYVADCKIYIRGLK